MGAGHTHAPAERESTDESLRVERDRTDTELANRAEEQREAAAGLVAEARDQADAVLADARELADRAVAAEPSVHRAREREDAVVEGDRSGADANADDEGERRRIALASLLAFEREHTDLRLETERVRADQALASRGDLLAMVSHDLRSLLGGIALSAELLKDTRDVEDPFVKVDKYVERIQRFSARMNRIVGDLVDVASIEAGKLSLDRVRSDPALVLRDALEAFDHAASRYGITLRGERAAAPGAVELDHERILQVLTNLVGNALKFTPRGGEIVLRLGRRGDDVCFAVTDSGPGIPAEMLDKIFERYVQLTEGERQGLGLGLYISKSIVDEHGGRIWAESTPGAGSTFFFTLPARS